MDEVSLPPGFSRETTIRRDAHGNWFHEGEPVTNPAVKKAFEGWIEIAEDGRFCLKNSVNWAYIELEGPAFFVRGLTKNEGSIYLELSGGSVEKLTAETIAQDSCGSLYCRVKDDRFWAQFESAPAMGLMEHIDEDEDGIYFEFSGQKYYPKIVLV